MPQFSIPCSVYRGGTSRGLFFQSKDLPEDAALRDRIFLTGIDSYNPSQVNGLGGTTSSTSKVCVLAPSSRKGADVDWTFYQLGTGVPVVDSKGTCGNLMAAVGAFAVDEGLVVVPPEALEAMVHVYNTNIDKIIRMTIPVVGGKARVRGGYAMPGVLGTGAMFNLSIMEPGGELTGSMFLLGPRVTVPCGGKDYEVTFSDCINPFIFISNADFGLSGAEALKDLAAMPGVLDTLNVIRDKVSVLSGIAGDETEAREKKPNVPKIALVAPPADYITTDGRKVRKDEVDILVKAVSMGKFHRTCPGSGLYNLAGAALTPGTVPNAMAGFPPGAKDAMVRIGHPEGVVEVRAILKDDGSLKSVGMERTARRIMRGDLFVPVDPE